MRILSFLLSFMLVAVVATTSNTSHAKRQVFTCDMYPGSTLQRKASRFNPAINSASKRYGVSKSLIKAVITVESCFNPRATGGLGEKGLMQLMPGTARQLGVRNGYNSWENIHGGAKYLKSLLKRFDGNKSYAAAAYNGGPGAVSRTHGPKFKQVKRYSRHVMRAYNKLARTPTVRSSRSVKTRYKRSKKSYRSRSTRQARSTRKASKRKASSKRKARRSAKVKSKAKVSKKTVATSKSRRSKKSASRSAKAVRAGAIKKTSKSRSRRARNAKRYRVRKGDTLYGISKSTGVSMKRLKRLNKLGNNKISVGRKLRLVRR